MLNLTRFISLNLLCITMAGCIPYHYTARPGVSGRVINAETHQPIEGASISFGRGNMENFKYMKDNSFLFGDTVALSKADGSFVVPPIGMWSIRTFSPEPPQYVSIVWVLHAGYETNYCKEFLFSSTGSYVKTNFGVIELKPISK
jgi:hypothetical protein